MLGRGRGRIFREVKMRALGITREEGWEKVMGRGGGAGGGGGGLGRREGRSVRGPDGSVRRA